nr:uncharacterized protein LOC107447304 isoform X3 [Parasteatoda tepidariorum]
MCISISQCQLRMLFLESLSMARIPVMSVSASINDPVAVVNTYCSYVSMLKDPVAKDESKLKALPESSGELEIQTFLLYVKTIYKDLPNYLHLMFELRPIPKVKILSAATSEPLLKETFTIALIQIKKS